MAITPREAIALTTAQERELVRHEESIDQLLKGISPTEVRKIRMPYGFTDSMYNRLKAKYTSIGWNVVKGRMQHYDDMPGSSGRPYEVDSWDFSIARHDQASKIPAEKIETPLLVAVKEIGDFTREFIVREIERRANAPKDDKSCRSVNKANYFNRTWQIVEHSIEKGASECA